MSIGTGVGIGGIGGIEALGASKLIVGTSSTVKFISEVSSVLSVTTGSTVLWVGADAGEGVLVAAGSSTVDFRGSQDGTLVIVSSTTVDWRAPASAGSYVTVF